MVKVWVMDSSLIDDFTEEDLIAAEEGRQHIFKLMEKLCNKREHKKAGCIRFYLDYLSTGQQVSNTLIDTKQNSNKIK